MIDCNENSKGCKGGEVTKILGYGKRKGFIEESCYTESAGTCPDDHFVLNTCRSEKNFYRVIDHCIADGIDGIKKEILKNGPVIGMMSP